MTIVVATDFSPAADRSARIAAKMAARIATRVHMVHVSTDSRAPFVLGTAEEHLLAPTRKALVEAAERLHADEHVEVEHELAAGSIPDALATAAERVVASMVVVSSPLRVMSRLRSSTAESLARQVRLPLLVVRAPDAFDAWLRGDRPLHVMVGSDLGAASTRALRFAESLRRFGQVELSIVSVASPDETTARLGLAPPVDPEILPPAAIAAIEREIAEQTRAACATPDRVLVHAGTAGPETHLAVLAESERADLVVVGCRRHSWLEQVWYGSIARGILRATSTNIVCVPRSLVDEQPVVTRTSGVIVAATDLSPLGDAAVPYAYSLAPNGATVHLVHCIDAGPFNTSGNAVPDPVTHRRLLERVPSGADARGVHTETHVLAGRPAETLVALAERVHASVICLGSHGRSGMNAAVMGSVAQEVVAKSLCPVLVVPRPRE
ncbi:MAG: universal stress protein [Polyangiaceae bacterium]|nr:universal stress protein [Polyangiaceae bacterium]